MDIKYLCSKIFVTFSEWYVYANVTTIIRQIFEKKVMKLSY